jgi:hypothetical protein
MKKMLFLAAGLLASPAWAGTPLWQNVEAGMTVEELRALYPASADVKHHSDFTEIDGFSPLEGCKSEVNIMHKQGVVDRILIKGAGALGGKCAAKVFDALVGKYGMPASNEEIESGLLSGSVFAKEGKSSVWAKDGVSMRFRRLRTGTLGSSWDLTYTAAASDVRL